MTDPTGPVLSVRGQARRTVPPDSATIFAGLEASASSKPAVLAIARQNFERVAADLRDLGGVVYEVGSRRHPLTWSVRAVETHPEYTHDVQTHRPELTGRVIATLSVHLTVRDFTLLDDVGERLAAHEQFNIHGVHWQVDDDNPQWPLVRAEAIHAAIRQGRDYAAALGGSLLRVEHVADAGLLGSGSRGLSRGGFDAAGGATMGAGGGGGPSLDPVPQELFATIEARFTTSPVTLPEAAS